MAAGARELLVELLLGDTWTDVTQWVRQSASTPVTITRGFGDEQGKSTPSTCTLTFDDRDGRFRPRNPSGAWYGLLGRNTPIRVAVDGERRFFGELTALTPVSDLARAAPVVKVLASGVLRRLGQGASPVRSPSWRYLTGSPAFTVAEYWPLDDDPAATVLGANAVTGGAAMQFQRETAVTPNTGAVTWGAQPSTLPVTGAVEITNGGLMTLPVRPGLTSSWSVMWAQRLSADAGGRVWLRCDNDDLDLSLIFFTSGSYQVFVTTSNPLASILLFSGTLGVGFDDTWHTIQISSHDAGGGTTTWRLAIDGGTQATSTQSLTFSPLQRIELNVPTATTKPGAWSTVVVTPGRIDDGTPDAAVVYHEAVTGYPGETAGRRLERLCAEQGIPFEARGDLDTTQPVGPQSLVTLVALLQECATADAGSLFEGRHDVDGDDTAPGLVYRTRYHQANQAPVATLDYAGRQVAPPLEPADDDQHVRNDVTVKRKLGGEYRAQKTTGGLAGLAVDQYPDGVGRYDTQVSANLATDHQAHDLAHWLLGLGTVNEERYPRVRVDLAAPDVGAALVEDLLALDVDDRLLLTGTAELDVGTIDLHTRGYTEVIRDAFGHSITFNCVPSSPYQTAELDNEFRAKLAPTTCQLAFPVDADDTSWTVLCSPLATTSAGQYPAYVDVEGEEVEVTAVAGAGPGQTLTVVRSINGISRAHAAGTHVRLSVNSRARLAL